MDIVTHGSWLPYQHGPGAFQAQGLLGKEVLTCSESLLWWVKADKALPPDQGRPWRPQALPPAVTLILTPFLGLDLLLGLFQDALDGVIRACLWCADSWGNAAWGRQGGICQGDVHAGGQSLELGGVKGWSPPPSGTPGPGLGE